MNQFKKTKKIKEQINLVDKLGNRIGAIEKMEAHYKGLLHEAFSIFVFNENNELLLQQRALDKYHSGGLWTNTCCSHPRFNEDIKLAVHRRLLEEMGFDCELKEVYSFIYKTDKLDTGLIEHEFDHLFVGEINTKEIKPNPKEVANYKWMKIERIKKFKKRWRYRRCIK